MITLTENAQQAVRRFIRGAETPVTGLRIAVVDGGCSGLEYKVSLVEEATEGDTTVDGHAFPIFVESQSLPHLSGITIDFYDGLSDSGFKFHNPNAKSTCGCGSSFKV